MRMIRSLAVLGLAVASVLCMPACETFQYTEIDALPAVSDYLASESIKTPEFDALWERGKQAVTSEGYVIDDDLTQFSERRIVSRWNTFLAPARKDGKRRRALVAYELVGKHRWVVRAMIESHVNDDFDDPLNPIEAEWDQEGADIPRSEILLWKIESGFRTPELRGLDDE